VILAIVVLEMVLNALVPLAFKLLIDTILPDRNVRLLVLVTVAMGAAVMVVTVAGVARDSMYARLVSKVVGDLRMKLYEHLQRLSMDFFGRMRLGDILGRFTSDLTSVETALRAVTWGVMPVFDIVITTALLFALDWRLALMAMLVWPLASVGPWLLTPRSEDVAFTLKEQLGGAMSTAQAHLGAPALIKAFGLEPWSRWVFGEQDRALTRGSARGAFLGALIERSANTGILVLWVGIFGVGAWLAFQGTTTIGTLAAFQALFITLSYAIYNVVQFAPYAVQANGGMRRIDEVLSARPTVVDAGDAEAAPLLQHGIEFRGVGFSYTGERKDLDGVSLTIPRGASVALVGASGSGKSTLLNLLLRFYDPTEGSLLLDGRDLRGFAAASWRAQLGVVFQEPLLFDASVRENVRCGRWTATEADVRDAIEAAGASDFVNHLPGGLDAAVGERGSALSGGQRQRLAIARAIVRDPAVLVLDEATSALDLSTETAVNEVFRRLGEGRTVISVTHRLASVVDFDRIFVLERGRLVEQGRHQELLGMDGVYAELWKKQSGFVVLEERGEVRVDPSWLRRVRVLEGLPHEALAELAGAFVPERYEADRVIVHEGDPGARFYVIVRGTVDVERAEAPGEPARRVAQLEDGDYFGEVALLERRPRNATVRTVTPTVCLSLSHGKFMEFLDRFPDVRQEMNRGAALRSARADPV
jgi:ATP-binding cassette subfamily B protein